MAADVKLEDFKQECYSLSALALIAANEAEIMMETKANEFGNSHVVDKALEPGKNLGPVRE